MNREIKVKYVFGDDKGNIHISNGYTLEQIEDMVDLYDQILLAEKACNCQPIGETNLIECNCDELWDNFVIKGRLQSNGLFDKNGTEIYEGDVLNSGRTDIKYIVEYQNKFARFIALIPNRNISLHADDWVNSQVIGNIYSNPELLK